MTRPWGRRALSPRPPGQEPACRPSGAGRQQLPLPFYDAPLPLPSRFAAFLLPPAIHGLVPGTPRHEPRRRHRTSTKAWTVPFPLTGQCVMAAP